MINRYLPPRNSLLWLISALSLSILPIIDELPIWLVIVWLGVVIWRVQIFRGYWQLPSSLNKTVIAVVCMAGLYQSFDRFLALDPMAALLCCALLLKLLEMQSRRDAVMLIYLSYFVIALQFLFSQVLSALLIGLVCFWIVTTALLVLNQPQGHSFPRRSLRLSGRILLHSFPLMILLFLIFPRIGSLWSMPLHNGGVTGVSDSMSPGDFSSLSRSGGVAFRVKFDGDAPKPEELYWRGLTFSQFDGRRWKPITELSNGWLQRGSKKSSENQSELTSGEALGRDFSYRIIFEPSQQHWLYSLMLPSNFNTAADIKIKKLNDHRLVSNKPVRQRIDYQVDSHLNYKIGLDITASQQQVDLRLPADSNPKSVAIAKQWRSEAGSDEVYIQRLLSLYNSEFEYTLEPPTLGTHTVDEFLWQTKQGFCGHFASSFVVMMRAAGIPARVVVGYQGGEYNKLEDYYVVHQYAAHAWAEVWLQGRGWVRYDPTAAVAPERVLQSLGDLASNFVDSRFSLGRYRQFALINSLRMQWDALNYRWHTSVMEFDNDQQSLLLSDWLNGITALKMAIVVLSAGGSVFILMTLHLLWRGRPKPVSDTLKAYARLERLLKSKGFIRQQGEPPGDFARRVVNKYPSVEIPLMQATRMFEQAQYESKEFSTRQMKQQLRLLKLLLHKSTG